VCRAQSANKPDEMQKQIADEVAILKATVFMGSVGPGSDVSTLPADESDNGYVH
jgi:hypothetical protein